MSLLRKLLDSGNGEKYLLKLPASPCNLFIRAAAGDHLA